MTFCCSIRLSGDVFIDYINNGLISSYSVVGRASPTFWTVAGVGDFNGDGTADILLFNRFSGDMFVDYINNGLISSYSVVGNANPSIWKPAGVGDYNGDGTSDILWFAQNSGTVLVDFMNQGVLSSYSVIGTEDPANLEDGRPRYRQSPRWKPIRPPLRQAPCRR